MELKRKPRAIAQQVSANCLDRGVVGRNLRSSRRLGILAICWSTAGSCERVSNCSGDYKDPGRGGMDGSRQRKQEIGR